METKNGGCDTHRRCFLGSSVAVAVVALAAGGRSPVAGAASLSEAQRNAMTPDQVIQAMLNGNARFLSGEQKPRDFLAEMRSSSAGQFPAAIVLSCVDSRAPVELICDLGIGDTFNARVAGNAVNDDILGSMEFACAASGAKAVVVMGHTACGAIKGAIDGVELGYLTGLVNKIKPAVPATAYSGERTSKNAAFVDEVARTNVLRTVNDIRQQSSVLAGLEKDGKIKIVGSMYHLVGGRVEFLA